MIRVSHVNLNELLSIAGIIKLGAISSFKRQNCSSHHLLQSTWSSCCEVQLSKTVCRSTHDYCSSHLPSETRGDSRSHAATFDVLVPSDMLGYCSRCDPYLPCEQRC